MSRGARWACQDWGTPQTEEFPGHILQADCVQRPPHDGRCWRVQALRQGKLLLLEMGLVIYGGDSLKFLEWKKFIEVNNLIHQISKSRGL